MSVTLDSTIQLTERLLQLFAVKHKEQGERRFSAVNLYDVVQNGGFTCLMQLTHPHFSRSEALKGLYVRILFLSIVPQ